MTRQSQYVIEPDKGWSWVVVFACWVVNLCTNGLMRSQGILFVALVDSFGLNRQDASWPFSLYIAMACFSGILTGILLQVFTVRQVLSITGTLITLGYFMSSLLAESTLAITAFYGIIAGFGNGFVIPSLAVVTNQYFLKHRTTANGISLSGIAVGALLFPFFITFLLETYGLRGTFLVTSGITLNIFVGATLIWPGRPFQEVTTKGEEATADYPCKNESSKALGHPKLFRTDVCEVEENHTCFERHSRQKLPIEDQCHQLHLNDNKQRKVINFIKRISILFHTTFKDPLYHLISLSALSSIFVLLIFVMIIVDHAMDTGLHQDSATSLLGYFAVPDLIGRLFSGWISDRGFVRRKNLFAASKALSGILMVLLPWVDSKVALPMLCAVLGLLEGVASILTSVLFVDYLGMVRLPTALSLWSFSSGIIFLATPSLIGVFRDFSGHYDSMFYLMGALSLTTAFAWMLEPWLVKKTDLST